MSKPASAVVAFDALRRLYRTHESFSDEELDCLESYFIFRQMSRKDVLFAEGRVFDFVIFIAQGVVRHYYRVEAEEKTCDLSFAGDVITDLTSFTSGQSSYYNLQALSSGAILTITRTNLLALYAHNPKFERVGRLLAEIAAARITSLTYLLTRYKPEERYQHILEIRPQLLEQVPMKYLANYLGIYPESLSRIRKRLQHRKS